MREKSRARSPTTSESTIQSVPASAPHAAASQSRVPRRERARLSAPLEAVFIFDAVGQCPFAADAGAFRARPVEAQLVGAEERAAQPDPRQVPVAAQRVMDERNAAVGAQRAR